jgi:hypothetical protein
MNYLLSLLSFVGAIGLASVAIGVALVFEDDSPGSPWLVPLLLSIGGLFIAVPVIGFVVLTIVNRKGGPQQEALSEKEIPVDQEAIYNGFQEIQEKASALRSKLGRAESMAGTLGLSSIPDQYFRGGHAADIIRDVLAEGAYDWLQLKQETQARIDSWFADTARTRILEELFPQGYQTVELEFSTTPFMTASQVKIQIGSLPGRVNVFLLALAGAITRFSPSENP